MLAFVIACVAWKLMCFFAKLYYKGEISGNPIDPVPHTSISGKVFSNKINTDPDVNYSSLCT